MGTGITIEQITAEDTLPLRRDLLYPGQPLAAVRLERDQDGIHFGVLEAGRLVSVGSLFPDGREAQFRKLATLQEAQGRGYGSMLIKHMQQHCREAGIPLLWCNARQTAEGFYTRLGFKRAGEYFVKSNITYTRMEQTLHGKKNLTVIPAIDIIDGKCVRLTQGDYAQQKVYNEHPLEVAKTFEDIGVKRLHLVDLDGARKGAVVNWKVLDAIAGKTSLVVDFGGGIKTGEDLRIVFENGAALATIGSIAVKDPELFFGWVRQYGPDKIFLGADVKEEKIAVGGWLETTDLSVFDFLEQHTSHGIRHIFCTDIAKDGLLQGPSIALYKKILERFPDIDFVASGGVSNIQDVTDLQEAGCSGVIIGKAIYEGRITMEALKELIIKNE
ncbi:1-(5-phosphoribosyl)-5-[(5-phosphoribosylamino)methylideneamino]imidazole-4-carboxamide isomerase [Chitinophaga japonensis]|uniref:1-(5-phosphoribosyl)-5-[(5-phosphoribosylamino)methylideneamino] imidazole-4-carboxamide isomerase n=1 Tax=Chitinophaga japonensis TaxID=104662 RepID=A0A562T459_CHIJA|nr:1-(5-phosphoribosyl)-5-[(5-phosphoribosylamino)methylideneamino]imidazole-4-carboxamide isomerase [Chitinophaga japonensis]TWI88325.1 1-(5-phosphoribosyl)-5-[(5-phosphoribosylamino)methylideneamino] imidazole-4-carboxamide isomerase [Chitinophaga japonensis]